MAFYAGLQALLVGLAATITNEYVLMVFYAVLPSNAVPCLTACFAAELSAFLYRHQMGVIKTVAGVS